ncbi:MAG TPA: alkaline shock response membrane anchor protein AmaP [Roseiflexaceae bacterium]|nr:alkaline shock response membrane anchor protein AmaP [Roseiflexaceae bacterium]
MHLFNRLVVVLLDVLLMAGAILLLLLTFGVLTPQQVVPAGLTETALGQWLGSFAGAPPLDRLLVSLLAGLVILGGLLLLALELRPAPQAESIVIRDDVIGRVTVQPKSVRDLISYTAAQLPDILQVDTVMGHSPQGLTIHCRTSLTPEAHIPQVTTLLQARIKQVVEQHLGLKVAVVTVDAQLDSLAGVKTQQRSQPLRRILR